MLQSSNVYLLTLLTSRTVVMFSFSFFAAYHGIRKTLELSLKQPWEDNIFFGSVIALSPFVVFPKYRPLFPYGVVLICLDTFNEYQDNSP